MAGFYPDVPGNRIAYDSNGSAYLTIPVATLVPSERSLAERQSLQDENSATSYGYGAAIYHTIIFPEQYDINGIYAESSSQIGATCQTWTSTYTTTGVDGTWVNRGYAGYVSTGGTGVTSRTQITAVNWTNINAVRFYLAPSAGNGWLHTLHLYGRPVSATADRLELWHPTLNQRVDGAYFDWGDAQRTTNATKTFRVKNLSPTLTANSVDITFETLTDTTPTYDSMHTFSDGGAYAGTINIGNLAPDALSSTITIRRDFPSNAVLGPWAGRINTIAGSWT